MPEPLADDDPRTVGRFTIESRLGAGGMGRVYLGRAADGAAVAIKVVRRELADDPVFRARFRHEVAAIGRVLGNHTAALIDADPDATQPWLATEYLPGPSLRDVVYRDGPRPAAEILRIIAGVADALVVIHAAGLVHRDLKPGNVLLAAGGPRVIDFGIARAAEVTSLTATGVSIGTPAYMAPEYVDGAEPGPPADVFALGGLIMFLATGRPPFGTGPDSALLYRITHNEPNLDGVPEPVLSVARNCLARDPARRPTAAAVAETCHRLLSPAAAPKRAVIRRFVAPPVGRRGRVGAIAVAVVGVIAMIALLLLLNRGTAPTPTATDDSTVDNQPAPGFVCAGTLNVTAGGPASAVRTVQRVAANYTILCPRTNIILYETAGPAEALPGFESGKYQMALIENEPIASDLESANCEPSDAVLRLPLVLNPIVVVYRLPDVSRLVLDAPTVARIFGGQITRWQDPAIVALNPGTSLPDLAINTMPIEDPAALTGYVADYLSRAAEGGWRGEFAGTGERTEDGVLTAVDINDGAIGYASYTAAQERLVPTAELATTSDPNTTATPNPDSIADAVTAALADTEGDLTKIQESLYGATATINVAPYPLVGVQHLLACRNYQNPDVGATVRDFLTIATTQFNDPMSLASGELADRIAEAAQAVK